MCSHWNYRLIAAVNHLHQCCIRPELYQVIELESIVDEDEAVSAMSQSTAQMFQLVSTDLQLWVNCEAVVAATLTELDKNVGQFVCVVLVVVACHHKYVIVTCTHDNTANHQSACLHRTVTLTAEPMTLKMSPCHVELAMSNCVFWWENASWSANLITWCLIVTLTLIWTSKSMQFILVPNSSQAVIPTKQQFLKWRVNELLVYEHAAQTAWKLHASSSILMVAQA